MTKNGIKQIIRKLKNYELDIRNVPEEIMYHKDMKMWKGLRYSKKCFNYQFKYDTILYIIRG